MIRSQLVLRLAAQNPQLYEKDCEAIVRVVLDRISEALAVGDRVEIRDFGVFTVREMRAKVGRNPRNGESVAVAEKKAVHFKTGKDMRQRVNASEPEMA